MHSLQQAMAVKTLYALSSLVAAVQAVAFTNGSSNGNSTAVSFTVGSSGGNATSPYQYGIMFEDINNSGDGGVYAELVQNRAFQGNTIYPKNLDWWHPIGGANLALANLSDPLSEALTTSMQVTGASNGSNEEIGFWNEGFWGFPVVSSWDYTGSFYMHGQFEGNITVALVSNTTGHTYAETSIPASSSAKWKQFQYTFTPTDSAPDSNNTLQFTMPASGVKGPLNFNLLSLFPPTYKNRPNGLRVDLMEAMANLKPSFFRMPGGNNIEGNEPPYWWDWKNTLGPLEDRPGYPGTWGYQNTDGLGLLEYLLWSEDLGMENVLAVWSGLYLNGSTVPEDELEPYVQDALDEIEFCIGDTSTKWGAYRAQLGHPEPFAVKFVEVGNEDSLNDGKDSYGDYRFATFYKAIKAAYPEITVMSSYYDVGPVTPLFDAAGDFHEYALPVGMSSQFGYFDNYTAAHPLLLGEYAVIEYDQPGTSSPSWDTGAGRAMFPFWYGSIAEAIYLLSAERNSDKVIGASYAPGFMNLNRWEWIPDMIAFDANPANLILSTSYYVVQFLSSVRITETLPTTEAQFDPAYWVAGRSDETGSHILKAVVYNSTGDVPFHVTFDGVGPGTSGTLTYLTAPMNASNYIDSDVVQNHESTLTADRRGGFSFKLPMYSVAILEIGAGSAGYADPSSRHSWKGYRQW
ncbi:glycoside hydrolase [Xylariaceae sp. FL0804]|nr:glycoside hydrolase [Xylariaceae sp. FL0804]